MRAITYNDVLDFFFGVNDRKRNFEEAYRLSLLCDHPDSVWVRSILTRASPKGMTDAEVYKHVLYDAAYPYVDTIYLDAAQDGRALYAINMLRSSKSLNEMRRAADLGYPRAQVWVGDIELLDLAADAGCPEAWAALAKSLSEAGDPIGANNALRKAAELGWLHSCSLYARLIVKEDYYEAVRFFARGFGWGAWSTAPTSECLESINRDDNKKAKFIAGRELRFYAMLHNPLPKWSGAGLNIERMRHLASNYVYFYVEEVEKRREACVMWMLVAKRLRGCATQALCKDIQLKICHLVWSGWEEWLAVGCADGQPPKKK